MPTHTRAHPHTPTYTHTRPPTPTPTPTATMEQPTGNQTPTTGTDGFTPHRDKGTQMPSQEIHISTINQSTQMPSQQRDPIIAAVDDLEPNHIKTSTPATTVQTTSPGPGIHQGTYS